MPDGPKVSPPIGSSREHHRHESDRTPGLAGLTAEVCQDAPIPLDAALSCGPDEVLAIFGPSGSGKTTLLRSIAGLHRPQRARIICAGETWADTDAHIHLPTDRRRVGFVFQDYALFPHLSARGNVMAALDHGPRWERRAAADGWLAAVHLTGFEARRPAALSGGQRQRVALARALARRPNVLLLDEPFAAVDRALRHRLHDELDELRRRVHVPILIVTHDFQDVIRMATHILWIDRGKAVAAGTVAALTSRTDLPWVEYALDTGSAFDARVHSVHPSRGLAELAFDGGTLLVPAGTLRVEIPVRVRVPARDVILAAQRPDGLSLHNILAGHVTALGSTAGDHMLVQIAIGSVRLLADVTRDAVTRLSLTEGAPVFALIKSVSIDIYGGAHAAIDSISD
jgi:molybdate transport system ATP-binding protein